MIYENLIFVSKIRKKQLVCRPSGANGIIYVAFRPLIQKILSRTPDIIPQNNKSQMWKVEFIVVEHCARQLMGYKTVDRPDNIIVQLTLYGKP